MICERLIHAAGMMHARCEQRAAAHLQEKRLGVLRLDIVRWRLAAEFEQMRAHVLAVDAARYRVLGGPDAGLDAFDELAACAPASSSPEAFDRAAPSSSPAASVTARIEVVAHVRRHFLKPQIGSRRIDLDVERCQSRAHCHDVRGIGDAALRWDRTLMMFSSSPRDHDLVILGDRQREPGVLQIVVQARRRCARQA